MDDTNKRLLAIAEKEERDRRFWKAVTSISTLFVLSPFILFALFVIIALAS